MREDGQPEPELLLESDGDEPDTSGISSAPGPAATGDAIERGGRMRQRLLERARQVQAEDETAPLPIHGDLDEIGQSSPPESELATEPPGLRPPGAPQPPRAAGRLSPTLVAVFGTLMGAAIVASLAAVVRHVLPRQHQHVEAAPPAPGPSAALPEAPRPHHLVTKPSRKKQPGPWRIKDAAGEAASRVAEGKVGSDAFLTAVQKVGVSSRDAYRLIAAFKGIKSFDKCNKQDRFSVLLDRATTRVKAFEYVVGPEEVFQAREGSDGLLKASKLDLKVERGQAMGALVYDGTSFDASAERAGFDAGLSRVISKALEGHLSLDELERGDMVRAIVQEVSVLGEFARYSGVEAVEVRRGGKEQPLRVYFFDAAGERGYYDAAGRAPYEGGWRKPIPNAPMTSPFNLKRMHPVLKKTMPHLGIDFGAPTGTPIGASSPGTVSFIGYAGPAGNLVKVEHSGGVVTGYAHMSRFAEGLKVGDKVKRLQLVGYCGSTGRSTGPHLHFTAQRNGEFFDPATLNLDAMRTISKDQRPAFDAVIAKYNVQLEALPLPEPLAPPPEAVAAAPSGAPAAAAPATSDPGMEEGEGDDGSVAVPAAPPPAAPAAPPPAAAAAAARPASGRPSIYLSDKELMQLQGTSDDGEVAE